MKKILNFLKQKIDNHYDTIIEDKKLILVWFLIQLSILIFSFYLISIENYFLSNLISCYIIIYCFIFNKKINKLKK